MPTKPSYSDKNHLRLIEANAGSFAGIDKEQNFVVLMPKDDNVAIARGDQATMKTSFLNLVRFAFTGTPPDNAINSKDKNLSASFQFLDKNGVLIEIRATKTAFKIFRVENPGEKSETKMEIKSPKDWLRDQVGEVGVDPVALRTMNTEKQLAWIRKMANADDSLSEVEGDLNKKIKEAQTNRTSVNTLRTRLKGSLLASSYYVPVKPHSKNLKPTDKYNEDKAAYQEDAADRNKKATEEFLLANDKVTLRNIARSAATRNQTSIDRVDLAIAELEAKLQTLRTEKNNLEEGLKKANHDISVTYKDVDEELAIAQQKVNSATEYTTKKTELNNAEKDFKDYQESVATYDKLTTAYENLLNMKDQFVASLTPEIDGLEVCISAGIDLKEEMKQWCDDNPDADDQTVLSKKQELEKSNREGIYVHGHTLNELSESELLAFCIKCWKYSGVRVLIIENISSYGTDAIQTVNEFAQAGAQVFVSLMERGREKMEITFYPEIPDKI